MVNNFFLDGFVSEVNEYLDIQVKPLLVYWTLLIVYWREYSADAILQRQTHTGFVSLEFLGVGTANRVSLLPLVTLFPINTVHTRLTF